MLALLLVGPITDPRARTWPRMLLQWLITRANTSAVARVAKGSTARRSSWPVGQVRRRRRAAAVGRPVRQKDLVHFVLRQVSRDAGCCHYKAPQAV
ncbi:hypothetical protein [Fodinibacter luteus]|uniref:hypothetical protein n=1 Tax=Fodinibacter luteus TaxID=552064 RepID=UPI0031E85C48